MESYTFGSDEFMDRIHDKADMDAPYPMTLNRTDFRVFTTILRDLALYGECTRSTRVAVSEILGTGTDDTEPIEEWAWGWLSGIGETLGVEGV